MGIRCETSYNKHKHLMDEKGTDTAGEKYYPIDKKILKQYNKHRKRHMRNYICHAPFKSLTFFLDGDIFACWYNKQFKLGKFPENTINEIWFGKKREQLKKHITNNDLTCGCDECERNFKNYNFHSTGALQYDRLTEKAIKYPVSLDFQISNTCNLECIMCHGEYSSAIRQNREKKELYMNPYNDEFVSQLGEFIPYLKRASFTGGEVFLTNIYYKIWEKIYQSNPATLISVTTNGTVLNDKVKDILEKLRFNITISIDSLDRDNYEIIRKNADYDKVLENIKYFTEYTKRKKTSLSARICPMRQNWKDLPELIKFLNDRNISIYFNKVIFPSYCALWNMEPQKLKIIIDYLSRFSFTTISAVQKNNKQAYGNLLLQLETWYKAAVNNEKKRQETNLLDCDQIFAMLKTKAEKYINMSKIHDNDTKQSFSEFLDEYIVACKKEITNKTQLKNALINFMGFPVNRFVDEFMIRNIDKLVDLTKQAGQITNVKLCR